jgi:hypothetical protein
MESENDYETMPSLHDNEVDDKRGDDKRADSDKETQTLENTIDATLEDYKFFVVCLLGMLKSKYSCALHCTQCASCHSNCSNHNECNNEEQQSNVEYKEEKEGNLSAESRRHFSTSNDNASHKETYNITKKPIKLLHSNNYCSYISPEQDTEYESKEENSLRIADYQKELEQYKRLQRKRKFEEYNEEHNIEVTSESSSDDYDTEPDSDSYADESDIDCDSDDTVDSLTFHTVPNKSNRRRCNDLLMDKVAGTIAYFAWTWIAFRRRINSKLLNFQ